MSCRLTIGSQLRDSRFSIQEYQSYFSLPDYDPDRGYMGTRYVGTTEEVENLRPKSPSKVRDEQQQFVYPGLEQQQSMMQQNYYMGQQQQEQQQQEFYMGQYQMPGYMGKM